MECLCCKKHFPPHRNKYRFCEDCRIDFGNEAYLDYYSFAVINEKKDRKEFVYEHCRAI